MPYTPPSVGRAGPDRPRQHAARTAVSHPAGLPGDRAAGRSQRLGQALQRHPLPYLHQRRSVGRVPRPRGPTEHTSKLAQERGGPSPRSARLSMAAVAGCPAADGSQPPNLDGQGAGTQTTTGRAVPAGPDRPNLGICLFHLGCAAGNNQAAWRGWGRRQCGLQPYAGSEATRARSRLSPAAVLVLTVPSGVPSRRAI